MKIKSFHHVLLRADHFGCNDKLFINIVPVCRTVLSLAQTMYCDSMVLSKWIRTDSDGKESGLL